MNYLQNQIVNSLNQKKFFNCRTKLYGLTLICHQPKLSSHVFEYKRKTILLPPRNFQHHIPHFPKSFIPVFTTQYLFIKHYLQSIMCYRATNWNAFRRKFRSPNPNSLTHLGKFKLTLAYQKLGSLVNQLN